MFLILSLLLLFLLHVQLIPRKPSFCPPTLNFFLCAPTNGFLNLHQPVSLGPFIAVTWGNYALDVFLLFPQNQIFPQKQNFQDTQRICCGFCCTSVPLPCLAWPACSHPSPESLTAPQASQNGQNSCLLVFILLFNPLSLSVSRTWDLLLTNGMWQEGWNVQGVPRLLESLSIAVFEKEVASPNSANNLQELRNRSFPSGASAENPVLGNTLIAAFCYPKQRIRLSYAWTPDPEKLQDNKCVLCEATELEVICYTTTENKYTRWSRVPRNSQEFQHGAPPSGCVFEMGSWRRISYTSRSSDSMHSWKGARVLPHSLGHPRLAPELLSEKGRQSSQSCIGLVSTQILRRKKHPLTARNWPGSISEDLVGNIHSQVVGFSCWT